MWLSTSGVGFTLSQVTNPHPGKTAPQLPRWIQKVGPSKGHTSHRTIRQLLNSKLTKIKYLNASCGQCPTRRLQWSGVFNTLLPVVPVGARANFDLGTWNARSFFCREPSVFNRKVQLVEKNKIHNIICVQEVRGSDALVKKHFRLIARTHWIFCNFSSGRKTQRALSLLFPKALYPTRHVCITHLWLLAE